MFLGKETQPCPRVELYRTRVGIIHPRQDFHQCGFAATVWANKAYPFPGMKFKSDGLEKRITVKTAAEPLATENQHEINQGANAAGLGTSPPDPLPAYIKE